MSLDELKSEYEVDASGRITSPGKFEGQPLHVVYYWTEGYLNGLADADNGEVLTFRVNAREKELFPALRRRKAVKLIQDDQGFVREV